MKKTLAVLAASALCLLVAAATVSALGSSAKPKLKPAGPNGIGAVKIGSTAGSLQKRGLIGKLQRGCELDPGQRIASLSRPLRGIAIFSGGGNKVTALSSAIGWETKAGVHPGMKVGKALAAYPKHVYVKASDNPTFGLGFIFVPNKKSTKMAFIVDPTKGAVVQIGIPTLSLCE